MKRYEMYSVFLSSSFTCEVRHVEIQVACTPQTTLTRFEKQFLLRAAVGTTAQFNSKIAVST